MISEPIVNILRVLLIGKMMELFFTCPSSMRSAIIWGSWDLHCFTGVHGRKGSAPAILLLLEGVTFLAGFQSMGTARFMYGMWGMYFQSDWYYGGTGVPVLSSRMLEGALPVLGYLAGGVLLEREAFSYGGNDQY